MWRSVNKVINTIPGFVGSGSVSVVSLVPLTAAVNILERAQDCKHKHK